MGPSKALTPPMKTMLSVSMLFGLRKPSKVLLGHIISNKPSVIGLDHQTMSPGDPTDPWVFQAPEREEHWVCGAVDMYSITYWVYLLFKNLHTWKKCFSNESSSRVASVTWRWRWRTDETMTRPFSATDLKARLCLLHENCVGSNFTPSHVWLSVTFAEVEEKQLTFSLLETQKKM